MDTQSHEGGDRRDPAPVAGRKPLDVVRVRDPGGEGVFPLLQGYAAEIHEPALDSAGEIRVAEAIADERIRFFLALRAGRPVGVCSLTIAWTTFGGGRPFGMFEDFFVSPEYRGSGVARALVNRVLTEADACQCASVIVGCADVDIPMYGSLGFTLRLGTMLAHVPG